MIQMNLFGLSRSIHPKDNKNTTDKAIKPLRDFEKVSIPLNMQTGPGCESLVKKGDQVLVGQTLGEPIGPWSVPVHASISGQVESVSMQILSDGGHAEYVTILSDGQETLSPEVVPPRIESRTDFLEAVRDAGLVGLGGAAFPTHIKLDPPPGKKIDTLIVNAAECEPYITVDHRICVEGADYAVRGALAVARWCGIDTLVFGIEDNKREAARSLKEAIGRAADSGEFPAGGVRVQILPTAYPTGAEKVLIRLVNGRIVPEGGLPADVGVIVQNVTTLHFLARYLETGLPLIKKAITLDGSALRSPGNFEVPIGAAIADVIEKAGGTKTKAAKIIMGGPMMGVAVDDIARPILKHNNAILVFDETDAVLPEESACIFCGRCARACPMRLLPMALDKAARANNPIELENRHVMNCIECGSCSYVCPAKRYLVQNIRNGKMIVRAAASREKGGKA